MHTLKGMNRSLNLQELTRGGGVDFLPLPLARYRLEFQETLRSQTIPEPEDFDAPNKWHAFRQMRRLLGIKTKGKLMPGVFHKHGGKRLLFEGKQVFPRTQKKQ